MSTALLVLTEQKHLQPNIAGPAKIAEHSAAVQLSSQDVICMLCLSYPRALHLSIMWS